MTYIPNTREKIKEPHTTLGKPEENGYWQGYLNEEDSREVCGYDWAMDILHNFFFNIDVYDVEFGAVFDLTRDEIVDVDESIIEDTRTIGEFSEEEMDSMPQITKVAKLFHDTLLDWLEANRDEMVVSMIENMDEEEYRRLKDLADNGQYKNAVIRAGETER